MSPERLLPGSILAPIVPALYIVLRFDAFILIQPAPAISIQVLLPALGLVVLATTPVRELGRIPIVWPVFAFLLWLAASRLWTESIAATESRLRTDLPSLVIVMLVVGTMRPAVVARTVLATGAAVCAWSVLAAVVYSPSRQFIEEGPRGPEQELAFRGTFIHKNSLGIFAVYVLIAALVFVRHRARPVILFFLVAVVLLSRSATAWSGLLAVTFIWAWVTAIRSQKRSRERALLVFLSIASAIAGTLLALRLLPLLVRLYQKDLTFSGRTTIWREAMKFVADRPLGGYGFAGLFYDFPPVALELQRWIGFDAAHSHNGAVGLLLDVGFIGLGLFALVLGSAFTVTISCLRLSETADYGRWGLLIVVALVLMSLSEPLFNGEHLGLLAIVVVTLQRVRNDERSTISRRVTASAVPAPDQYALLR